MEGPSHSRSEPIIHTRIDAAQTLDQFFWDPTPGNTYKTAIGDWIEPKLAGIVKFHSVSQSQASKIPKPLGDPLDEINFNSDATSAEVKNFAIYFHLTTNPTAALASAGALGKTGAPILVRLDLLFQTAQLFNYAPQMFTAIVIGHEIAHRFNLRHYSKFFTFDQGISEVNLQGLAHNRFALNSQNLYQFYVETNFLQTSSGIDLADRALPLDALQGNPISSVGPVLLPSPLPANATNGIVRWSATSPLTLDPIASPPGNIFFEVRRKYIMDWRLMNDPTMSSLQDWDFSPSFPTDISNISLNTTN